MSEQTAAEAAVHTLDELIRVRAAEMGNKPLISYPNKGVLDFEDHSARDLDRYVDIAATKLEKLGLPELDGFSPSKPPVVAILAQSGLHVIVTMIALNRLGYTCFLLSTRLVGAQLSSLLEMTTCDAVLTTPNFHPVLEEVVSSSSSSSSKPHLSILPLIMHSDYYSPSSSSSSFSPRTPRKYSLPLESRRIAIIIHSSGSTGLPKPIYLSNAALVGAFAVYIDKKGLLTSPLFHSHGFYEVFRSIYCRNVIYIGNYSFPLTARNLVDMLRLTRPEVFHCVPYVIKLLAESEGGEGIEALRIPDIVLFAGSSCPDDLGDMLVRKGVKLVGNYGATETGRLMNSTRPEGDLDWNYLRLLPTAEPFVLMDEISPGSNLYECVCLDGLKSKSTVNSQDPPNSFRTRDLWQPHPTRRGLWKYTCRLDDRFTLVNGEKVLPLRMEGRVRQEKGVREAIVFGEGRSCAGVLVVRADGDGDRDRGDEDEDEKKRFLEEEVWPAVEEANTKAETFARVPRDLVVVVPAGTEYPRTDKGTFIRAAAYKRFEKEIGEAYRRFEEGGAGGKNGHGDADDGERVKLEGVEELEGWLREKLRVITSGKEVDVEDDFFASGVDSLQCIQMWGLIRKDLDLGGRQTKLGQNILYETGNVRKLAEYLEAMRRGEETAGQTNDEVRVMEGLIEKYSSFQPRVTVDGTDGVRQSSSGDVYLVTGATGGLGAHLVGQLVNNPKVSAVWTLVRAQTDEGAAARVLSSLKARGILLGPEAMAKLVPLKSDLSRSDFGLEPSRWGELKSNLTAVIHSAWAVNFNISVQSFEDQHIKATHNLIQLCLSTAASSPAKFFFCSSVSATGGTPRPGVVSEGPAERPEYAQGPGYGRSKYVGEHITINAARNFGVPARVLRIGQLIGDTHIGEWNANEGIPMMIQTAVTLGVLPQLDETMTWLPIDYAASTILDVADAEVDDGKPWDTDLVYHVLNPKRFHWAQDMLPSLSAAGLSFQSVSTEEWMERMRASSRDPSKNPPIRLLDWFEGKYGGVKKKSSGGLEYLTDKTRRDSKTLCRVPDVTQVEFIKLLVERLRIRWAEMVKE